MTPPQCKAVLLGYTVPDHRLDLLRACDAVPAIQTVNFSWALYRVLEHLGRPVQAVLITPLRDWPLSRPILVRGDRFADKPMRAVSYVNLVILKHLTRFVSTALALRDLRRGDVLLVHGLNAAMLLAAIMVKQRGVVLGLAVTDEQGIILPTDGLVRRWLKRVDGSVATALSRQFDFGIALSEALSERYVCGETIVVPGIFMGETWSPSTSDEEEDGPEDRSTFTVGYFGTLAEAYGVRALLESVSGLPPTHRVAFFGAGPLSEQIAEAADNDERVIWGGFLDRGQIRAAMAAVDALINPRPADTREAALSFPSKLIEYAAIGRPVITTRMPALPPAMRDAAVLIEQSTPAGVAEAIRRASALDRAARRDRARCFRDAVSAACSPSVIASRLNGALETITNRRRAADG